MSNDINLSAILKADGELYYVLCLDIASNEARLWDESRKRDFYVGLECIELDTGLDIIGRIYEWNKSRGLLEKGYKKSREASFIAEELSELLRGDELASDIDAYIDSIIFQLGALSKILQSKERIKRCFEAVLDANGKIIKNRACFVEPNEVIKAVLNECENENLKRAQDVVKTPYDRIITHFSYKSNAVFIFFDLNCVELAKTLKVNHIVAEDVSDLTADNLGAFLEHLQGKNIFLIKELSQNDFKPLNAVKSLLNDLKSKLFTIDFSVLKYFYLIDKNERSKNRYSIGIDTPCNDLVSFIKYEILSFSELNQSELSKTLTGILKEIAQELGKS